MYGDLHLYTCQPLGRGNPGTDEIGLGRGFGEDGRTVALLAFGFAASFVLHLHQHIPRLSTSYIWVNKIGCSKKNEATSLAVISGCAAINVRPPP